MDKNIRLYHEETGVQMDFAVKREIAITVKNEKRLFLVLSPLHRETGSGWDRMMEDPGKAFCILEKKETRREGTCYLRVEKDLLTEVSAQLAANCSADENGDCSPEVPETSPDGSR